MMGPGRDVNPEKIVLRRKQRVQRVRDEIWAEGIAGRHTAEAKQKLALAAMSYWDVLRDYRDESAVDADDYPDMSPVHSRIGKTTTVLTEAPGDTTNMKSETAPMIADLDGDKLISITEQLDDVATALGFSADVGHTETVGRR